MKRYKALALTLAVLMLALPLFSCSKEDTDPIMSFRGEEISAGLFSYMMASQKAYIKDTFESNTSDYYAENNSYPYGTDNFDEFLSKTFTKDDGTELTYAQNAFNTVVNTAKMFAVVNAFCDSYDLVVTDTDAIADIDEAVSMDIANAGGENYLNDILGEFDASVDTEREYLYNMERVDLLYDYLYGDTGTQRVADSLVSDEFYKNYRKIDFIYYPFYTEDDSSGDRVKLGDDVITDITAKADDFYSKLTSGETAYEDYDSHDDYAVYDEGVCYTGGTLTAEFEEAADSLENTGDICKVAYDDGVYILRLLEAGEDDYKDYYDEIYTTLAKTAYYDYLESYYAEVTVDSNKLSKYDFATYELIDISIKP